MKTNLLNKVEKEELDELKSNFIAAKFFRKTLIEVLNEKIESLRVKTSSSSAYNSPSWPYMQADGVGYERAMREVISLLSEEKLKN